MRNMKIPVENNLDEIVGELERLGYSLDTQFHNGHKSNSILTWDNGTFEGYKSDMSNLSGSQVVNLADLKEM